MGMCLESTPEMGEYSVEVRRESFYLRGEDTYSEKKRHAIECYTSDLHNQGTIEILIEDLSKVKACLDAVEAHANKRKQ